MSQTLGLDASFNILPTNSLALQYVAIRAHIGFQLTKLYSA